MARKLFAWMLVALGCTQTVAFAQTQRVQEVAARRDECEAGSDEWFRWGFELVEAQLSVDVEHALATADELCQTTSATPGLTEASYAYSALARTLLEGVTAAAEWRARAEWAPSDESPAWLRACYEITRSRRCCVERSLIEEHLAVVAAEENAEASGDPTLVARAQMLVHHTGSDIGLETAQSTFAIERAAVEDAGVDFLRARLAYDEHILASLVGDADAADRALDRSQQLAEAEGNRRVLAAVSWRRGVGALRGGDLLSAVDHFELARELAAQMHDLVLECQMLQFQADATFRIGDLDGAEELIALSEDLTRGRGLHELELGQMQTRFDIAVAKQDSLTANELAPRIEHERADNAILWQRYIRVRDEVRRAKLEQQATQASLAEEQQQAAAAVRMAFAICAVVAIAALSTLAFSMSRSRKRLLGMNGQLRAQMQKVEEAQAARDELQERLRRLERAESLGLMASGVAHDFNNLLTSILGGAELLGAFAKEPQAQRVVQLIASASEQAARLCRQLQLYASAANAQLAPLDLCGLAADVKPVLESACKNEVQLVIECEAPVIQVQGDRTELEQLLLNLVLNARDAHARTITMRVRRVAGEGARGSVSIEVADDGDGMPGDVVERIFDPFFTTRFPGRGLGLAVVHGVVSRHNGRIEVASEVGRGTCFSITLPCADGPAPPPALPTGRTIAATAATSERATVVVVDDELGVRRVLHSMLALLGHAAYETENGAQAEALLAQLQVEGPLLIVVDLTMPGVDGPETFRALRRARPEARFILTSGHPNGYVEEVARELQADAVLLKPFHLSAVEQAVASALDPLGASAES